MSLIPQLGMAELLLLAVLALVVVGPKDLPRLMRAGGKVLSQVRRMADDFRMSFDQMAREAEIDEMRKEIEELKSANPLNEAKSAIDEASAVFNDDEISMTPLSNSSSESAPDTKALADENKR